MERKGGGTLRRGDFFLLTWWGNEHRKPPKVEICNSLRIRTQVNPYL